MTLPAHCTGTFRYATVADADAAAAHARAILADDDLAEAGGEFHRCFVLGGSALTVDVAVPWSPGPRFVVAAMFAALARSAIAGSAEVRRGDTPVDRWDAGDED